MDGWRSCREAVSDGDGNDDGDDARRPGGACADQDQQACPCGQERGAQHAARSIEALPISPAPPGMPDDLSPFDRGMPSRLLLILIVHRQSINCADAMFARFDMVTYHAGHILSVVCRPLISISLVFRASRSVEIVKRIRSKPSAYGLALDGGVAGEQYSDRLLHQLRPPSTGTESERLTCPSAKLDSIEATLSSRVSLSFRKRS